MRGARPVVLVLAVSIGGCTSISIEPSCPEELQVGESGEVKANVTNPGAIPTYRWQAIPAGMGTLETPDQPATMFTASNPGEVTLRLTATDGIFQVQSQCKTRIVESALEVTLDFAPAEPTVGEVVTLTCTALDGAGADFLIMQTDGPAVELAESEPGVVTFTAQAVGEYAFECIGETPTGAASMPAGVNITVMEDDGGGRDGRGGSRR